MEIISCKTKKVISVLLIILMIGTFFAPTANAASSNKSLVSLIGRLQNILKIIAPKVEEAVIDEISVGDIYKVVDGDITNYKTKNAAKTGNFIMKNKSIKEGAYITIAEIYKEERIIKTEDGRYIKFKEEVYGKLKKIVKVEGIEIVLNSVNIDLGNTKKIFKGDSATLKVAGRVNGKNVDNISGVTWKSSDTNIVKVNNGKITGKETGTATITVKYEGKSAKCKIEVVNKEDYTCFYSGKYIMPLKHANVVKCMGEETLAKVKIEEYTLEGFPILSKKVDNLLMGATECKYTNKFEDTPEVRKMLIDNFIVPKIRPDLYIIGYTGDGSKFEDYLCFSFGRSVGNKIISGYTFAPSKSSYGITGICKVK